MNLSGEYRIQAGREAVWRAINDPDVLRRCIPGCEEIVRESPTDWTATVVAKVGPVKARMAGRIRLEDLDPPASCRIVGEGDGGAAGFAKGAAKVALTTDGAATLLRYDAETEIGGKLAQIGARLIDSFARKYADEFFQRFAEVVGAPAASAGEAQPSAIPDATSTRAQPGVPAVRPPSPALAPGIWRFDSQAFTILVLAALLVFMTIMYALKP